MKAKKAWEAGGGGAAADSLPKRNSRKSPVINLNIFSLKDAYRGKKAIMVTQKRDKSDATKVCQFHSSVKTIMWIAQFFGIMPIRNILSNNLSELKFKLWAWQTVYSLFCIACLFLYNILVVVWVIHEGVEFNRCVTIIFYTSNCMAVVCFLQFSAKWPKIIRRWQTTEELMLPVLKENSQRSQKRKILVLTVVVLILSMIEHILSIATNIHNANVCPEAEDKLRAVFTQQFGPLFTITPYATWKAMVARFILTIGTFAWNYMDCFVIIISVGLSQNFKMLNKELRMLKRKNLPQHFWERKRIHYRSLCDLCEKVDNAVSKITAISFSNNLFFICYQLLRSVNKLPSSVHYTYFWFSLIFLVSRTLAVSLYSAEINDESKRIVEVIRVAPKESWCIELRRFYDEVTNDMVALTGMKFFYLTKRLVLSVAGTIITYELVLIQFDQDEETANDDLCVGIRGVGN